MVCACWGVLGITLQGAAPAAGARRLQRLPWVGVTSAPSWGVLLCFGSSPGCGTAGCWQLARSTQNACACTCNRASSAHGSHGQPTLQASVICWGFPSAASLPACLVCRYDDEESWPALPWEGSLRSISRCCCCERSCAAPGWRAAGERALVPCMVAAQILACGSCLIYCPW